MSLICFLQIIMPRSKDGKKREPVDAESIKKALDAVLCTGEKKISIREACKVFNVKFTTLVRHLKNLRNLGKKPLNATLSMIQIKCLLQQKNKV